VATGTSPKFTPVTMGLAMVAGLGLTLMVVALGIGTIQGAEADANAIGLFFAAGLGLMVTGIVGWIAVVQPYKHFDDINVPMDSGHHGHDEAHADDHSSEHAAHSGH